MSPPCNLLNSSSGSGCKHTDRQVAGARTRTHVHAPLNLSLLHKRHKPTCLDAHVHARTHTHTQSSSLIFFQCILLQCARVGTSFLHSAAEARQQTHAGQTHSGQSQQQQPEAAARPPRLHPSDADVRFQTATPSAALLVFRSLVPIYQGAARQPWASLSLRPGSSDGRLIAGIDAECRLL